jgi:hypothetical protein
VTSKKRAGAQNTRGVPLRRLTRKRVFGFGPKYPLVSHPKIPVIRRWQMQSRLQSVAIGGGSENERNRNLDLFPIIPHPALVPAAVDDTASHSYSVVIWLVSARRAARW